MLLNRESAKAAASLKKLEEEKAVAASITSIIPITCDLLYFDSVKSAAEQVNATCEELGGLNVLANNAGIAGFPDDRSKDGYEVQMQTNHLSHCLLAKILMPSFQIALENNGEVRICQHSSVMRHGGELKAKYFEKSRPETLGSNSLVASVDRYHHTKLSNTTFAMALHKNLREKGFDILRFKSVVAEPGFATTDLMVNATASNMSWFTRLKWKLATWRLRYFSTTQSAADGALSMIEACFGEDVNSGDFFHPNKIQTGFPYKAISKGVLTQGNENQETETLKEENQQLVWAKSEEAFGDFFEFSKL